MNEYKIYLEGQQIGTSKLEKADAPMGVVFGRINPSTALDYNFIKKYCKSNNVQLATDYEEDKFLATYTIDQLRVINNKGIEIKGIGNQIAGMDGEGFEISIEGIPYPFYQEEFPHHRKEYDEMFTK